MQSCRCTVESVVVVISTYYIKIHFMLCCMAVWRVCVFLSLSVRLLLCLLRGAVVFCNVM
jgi:hypothetical protein